MMIDSQQAPERKPVEIEVEVEEDSALAAQYSSHEIELPSPTSTQILQTCHVLVNISEQYDSATSLYGVEVT